ncbi:DUF4926 domain-containing protein [Micromonospora sp. WMMD1128]|uniref:DUF4926 domain-containing protein n=1 Tax=Micromonospora sp. WMMD1128 TaxID=3015150 RepID=UPI00248C40AC|nr:DUF4926 domain-containing protein [Micromonospora sp. WMMD1128]WBB76602.1 DUF4926 domain-containing protein [Micromonospora sp. WMMD1128]
MELYDLVRLREALPEENLPAGMLGTIVHVFHQPQLAYEVEFADQDGRTLSSVALTPEKILPVSASDAGRQPSGPGYE